jgi:hypothetical protein
MHLDRPWTREGEKKEHYIQNGGDHPTTSRPQASQFWGVLKQIRDAQGKLVYLN